jgi:hypothetical protein
MFILRAIGSLTSIVQNSGSTTIGVETMRKTNSAAIALMAAISMGIGHLKAAPINNDIAAGTLGHFEVDVTPGGQSTTGFITGTGTISGLVTTEVIFGYTSYVDIGSGGFSLGGTTGAAGAISGDDEYTSSGSFVGSGGNTIEWEVVSSIASGAADMINAITFTAATGTLGTLQFSQYLDEDVLGVSDDVLFVRGSVAGGDLELFTVDDDEEIGISHGGSYSAAQGLSGATFDGWAADEFADLRSAITGGTATYSPTGVVDLGSLPAFVHPTFGAAFGPEDITSALAWTVDPGARTATILTSLGGVPDAGSVPNPDPAVPEPTSMALFGLTALGFGVGFRRRRGGEAAEEIA